MEPSGSVTVDRADQIDDPGVPSISLKGALLPESCPPVVSTPVGWALPSAPGSLNSVTALAIVRGTELAVVDVEAIGSPGCDGTV